MSKYPDSIRQYRVQNTVEVSHTLITKYGLARRRWDICRLLELAPQLVFEYVIYMNLVGSTYSGKCYYTSSTFTAI